jgi:hypothetical protein
MLGNSGLVEPNLIPDFPNLEFLIPGPGDQLNTSVNEGPVQIPSEENYNDSYSKSEEEDDVSQSSSSSAEEIYPPEVETYIKLTNATSSRRYIRKLPKEEISRRIDAFWAYRERFTYVIHYIVTQLFEQWVTVIQKDNKDLNVSFDYWYQRVRVMQWSLGYTAQECGLQKFFSLRSEYDRRTLIKHCQEVFSQIVLVEEAFFDRPVANVMKFLVFNETLIQTLVHMGINDEETWFSAYANSIIPMISKSLNMTIVTMIFLYARSPQNVPESCPEIRKTLEDMRKAAKKHDSSAYNTQVGRLHSLFDYTLEHYMRLFRQRKDSEFFTGQSKKETEEKGDRSASSPFDIEIKQISGEEFQKILASLYPTDNFE